MTPQAPCPGAGRHPKRSAFYIDGFNLYHAIADLGAPHLKWLNLWALANRLIPSQSETLVKVVWCSAVITKHNDKMLRHRAYRKALEAAGVTCLGGHFVREPRKCRARCQEEWEAWAEKEGDVNVAISLIDDAHRDLFDVAYLVTADSDQAATARLLKERFPDKSLISVAPPGRRHSKAILAHTPSIPITIRESALEWCIFGPAVLDPQGNVVVMRPNEYAPPPGWVHPSQRK